MNLEQHESENVPSPGIIMVMLGIVILVGKFRKVIK